MGYLPRSRDELRLEWDQHRKRFGLERCRCARCERRVEAVRVVVLALATAVVLFGIALTLTGCGASVLDRAVLAANGARDLEVVTGEALRIRCTEAYKRATAVQVPALDRPCIPARRAYGGFRSARLALMAGILTARAGGAADLLTRMLLLSKAANTLVEAADAVPEP